MITKTNVRLAGVLAAAFLAGGLGLVAHAQMVGVTLPTVPTSVSAVINTSDQISISWGASTESSGTIGGYYVYRNGVRIATTAGTLLVDPVTAPGIYAYAVAAYDATGNVSAQSSPSSVTFTADTTPPSVPTGVSVTGTTSTNSVYTQETLTVSWSGSSDNVGVVGYYVYRNGMPVSSSTSGAALAITGTSMTDKVPPGTYIYTVAAYDAAQNASARSAPVTVTIGVDNTAPYAPTGLSVRQVSAGGADLAWASSTDNVGVAGYQIFRNGIQIATTTGITYGDTGLTAGTVYTYTVTAYDVAWNISSPSSAVKENLQAANGPGTPVITSAALSGTSTVVLSWVAPYDALPISTYALFRNGTQIASVTSTGYSDMGLAAGMYSYTISATDSGAAVSISSAPVSVFIPNANAAPAQSSGAAATAPATVATSSGSGVATGTGTTAATSLPTAVPLTQYLYLGLRSAQVTALQSLLIKNGDLLPAYATGYFGNLTLTALEKFQCDASIVCTGGAGWGFVGPKTRKALNSL
ncbi:MAG: hypothetical protein P4L67_02840 [Candidatus Pacebacteria bacterium]|nr:hypothetical protein [Candidatus Paceibacterota bacterium]